MEQIWGVSLGWELSAVQISLNLVFGLGATAPGTGSSRKQAAAVLCGACWKYFQYTSLKMELNCLCIPKYIINYVDLFF